MTQNELEEVQTEFLEDIKNHEMITLFDNGQYRHLRFKKQNSRTYQFDIITWPNNLVITGDVASYSFSRTEDMFEFFRDQEISPEYWHQKCYSRDSRHEIQILDRDRIKECMIRDIRRYTFADIESRKEFFEILRKEIWDDINLFNETEMYLNISNFTFKGEPFFSPYGDFHTHSYSPEFVWCLYAILWAISVYDKHKNGDVQ